MSQTTSSSRCRPAQGLLLLLVLIFSVAALPDTAVAQDRDGDGVPDATDCGVNDPSRWRNGTMFPDLDGDTIRDSTRGVLVCYGNSVPLGFTLNQNGPDNCVGQTNADQANFDGDAKGDLCDTDDDNDGTLDTADCAPFDPTRWQSGNYYPDQDGDNVRDEAVPDLVCYGAIDPPPNFTQQINGPDNCPTVPNPTQRNADGDALGDACDNDDDNDGVNDPSDCGVLDPTVWRLVNLYPDGDGDDVRNDIVPVALCYGEEYPEGFTTRQNGPDNCPGVPNPNQQDSDGDGVGDLCESDDDGDNTPDGEDCAPNDPTRWRNAERYPDGDIDGVRNTTRLLNVCYGDRVPPGYTTNVNGPDNCPSHANPDQADADDDGFGDLCDDNDDFDNTPDDTDCAPHDSTRWRHAEFYPDQDLDGISDTNIKVDVCYGEAEPPAGYRTTNNGPDNCPSASNPDQLDSDGDGTGDACDETNDRDRDNDGRDDAADCAPLDPLLYRNLAYSDPDLDGVADSAAPQSVACFGATAPTGYVLTSSPLDNCPGIANADQADGDGDGVGDLCETGNPDQRIPRCSGDGVTSALPLLGRNEVSIIDPVIRQGAPHPAGNLAFTRGSSAVFADFDPLTDSGAGKAQGKLEIALTLRNADRTMGWGVVRGDATASLGVLGMRWDKSFACHADDDGKADPASYGRRLVNIKRSKDSQTMQLSLKELGAIRNVTCLDVDGDGIDELLVHHRTKSAVRRQTGSKEAVTTFKLTDGKQLRTETVGELGRKFVVLDADGDGTLDYCGIQSGRPTYSQSIISCGSSAALSLTVPVRAIDITAGMYDLSGNAGHDAFALLGRDRKLHIVSLNGNVREIDYSASGASIVQRRIKRFNPCR